MYPFQYSPEKIFFVTKETIQKTPATFPVSGKIWEPESISYFYSLVNTKHNNKDAVIIDVGAQTGLYSLYAKFLPQCSFYAFEPFQESYSLLNDNLKLNNITNVFPIQCALGSVNENKILRVPSHTGLNTLGDTPTRFTEWNDFEVPVRRLDDILFNNVPSIDYIKCDTEGWELHVLKGAEECIRRWKPELFFELNDDNLSQCSLKSEMLIDYVKSLGYKYVTTKNYENVHYTYQA